MNLMGTFWATRTATSYSSFDLIKIATRNLELFAYPVENCAAIKAKLMKESWPYTFYTFDEKNGKIK